MGVSITELANGERVHHLFWPSVKTRMICRARYSLISLWRGTGWLTFVAGFMYQSCRPPCRARIHPAVSSSRMRSRRFMRVAVPRPAGHAEQARRGCRNKYLSGFQPALHACSLESCSRGSLQDTPTRHPHLPSKHNELISCRVDYYNFLLSSSHRRGYA